MGCQVARNANFQTQSAPNKSGQGQFFCVRNKSISFLSWENHDRTFPQIIKLRMRWVKFTAKVTAFMALDISIYFFCLHGAYWWKLHWRNISFENPLMSEAFVICPVKPFFLPDMFIPPSVVMHCIFIPFQVIFRQFFFFLYSLKMSSTVAMHWCQSLGNIMYCWYHEWIGVLSHNSDTATFVDSSGVKKYYYFNNTSNTFSS